MLETEFTSRKQYLFDHLCSYRPKHTSSFVTLLHSKPSKVAASQKIYMILGKNPSGKPPIL